MNGDKKGLIGIVIQGGCIGISLVSIYFLYDLATTTLAKNAEVLTEVRVGMEAQTTATNGLIRVVDNLDRTLLKTPRMGNILPLSEKTP